MLNPSDQTSWCVARDFNKVVGQSEKLGGEQRGETQMCKFRKALVSNELWDLGYRGGKFMWCNGHIGGTFTIERLDRCVINNSWREVFKEVWVEVLPARCSNHKSLVLNMFKTQMRRKGSRKLFRFEVC